MNIKIFVFVFAVFSIGFSFSLLTVASGPRFAAGFVGAMLLVSGATLLVCRAFDKEEK